MGLLSNGLETLEVGATAWRLIINSNLEKLYSRTEAASTFLAKAGGTLTGFLTLHANPTANLHAATKGYVDTVASGIVTSSAVATFTNKTLDDITNIVGADHVHYKVKNQTGSTIAKGVLVKAISYETGEESIRVAPCSSASDVAIGITEAAITSGSYGLAINTGVVSGLDTGTYAVNTILYNNGLGGLTATKPTSGMYQACAVVIRQQQVTGALLVEFTEPGKVNWDDRYYTETEIDAIMGAAGLLPSQTGHTGHYLRTDGTAAYWDSVTFDPGDETIAGIKTFTSSPIVPAPTLVNQAISMGNIIEKTGAGIGYGTGSGGTVTQLTSKATAVTLNKPSGQIVMNNSLILANSVVAFDCYSSSVSINDTCVVTIKVGSVSFPSNYKVQATTIAGGIYFQLNNVSAGSLSEAVVLNYSVIKGAIA